MQLFIQIGHFNFISGIAIIGHLSTHQIENHEGGVGSAHFAEKRQFKLINGIKIDNQFLLEFTLKDSLMKTCYVGFFRNGMSVMDGVHVDDMGN